MSRRVTIIGGGIAGLASAYYLERTGDFCCALLESRPRLGGTIQTQNEDGFLVEAGPDSIITTKPAGIELATAVGLEADIIEPSSRRFFVFHGGRLRSVPAGFASLAPTSVTDILTTDLLSFAGKLRILSEPLRKRSDQEHDESIRSFFERRLGKAFTRVMAEPLFAGIHAGKGDRLSMRALLPQFLDMESQYGSLASAVRARAKPSRGKRPPVFVSLKRGMASLVSGIAQHIPRVDVRTGVAAKRLTRGDDGLYYLALSDGSELTSEHVIIATHASIAADLLEDLDTTAAARLRGIPYASTAALTLAMDSTDVGHPLDGTGCLVPGELQMTACTWSASKWAGRAPDGKALFRCFYGRDDDADALALDDDALLALAESELARILPLRGSPTHRWVHRWENAMPQYRPGHLDAIDGIEEDLGQHPGIHLVGSAYRGVGIPDCVRQARALAESIAGENTHG